MYLKFKYHVNSQSCYSHPIKVIKALTKKRGWDQRHFIMYKSYRGRMRGCYFYCWAQQQNIQDVCLSYVSSVILCRHHLWCSIAILFPYLKSAAWYKILSESYITIKNDILGQYDDTVVCRHGTAYGKKTKRNSFLMVHDIQKHDRTHYSLSLYVSSPHWRTLCQIITKKSESMTTQRS